jgi:hypothetical protein
MLRPLRLLKKYTLITLDYIRWISMIDSSEWQGKQNAIEENLTSSTAISLHLNRARIICLNDEHSCTVQTFSVVFTKKL